MFDVIAFGSATRDLYMVFKNNFVCPAKKAKDEKSYCFELGSKVEADQIYSYTGGGGTNAAAGLTKLGFKCAWAGMVGQDFAGRDVLEELSDIGVDISLSTNDKKIATNQSVIIMQPGQDRTILVYRGASSQYGKDNIAWDSLEASWFYIAPLTGKNLTFLTPLINFAVAKGTKLFLNPSMAEIETIKKGKMALLKKIDILSVNETEAAFLTGKEKTDIAGIIKEINKHLKGICVLTMGSKGAVVFDKEKTYSAGILDAKVIDRTGAGDSFNSGFLAGFMQTGDIISALQLATANATKNVSGWGAKNPLLTQGERWAKIKVAVKNI